MRKRCYVWLLCSWSTFAGVLTASAQIQDLSYHSKLNEQAIPIKVYLPPGYQTSTQRYLVVYNLHGGGGSPERQWDRMRKTLTEGSETGNCRHKKTA